MHGHRRRTPRAGVVLRPAHRFSGAVVSRQRRPARARRQPDRTQDRLPLRPQGHDEPPRRPRWPRGQGRRAGRDRRQRSLRFDVPPTLQGRARAGLTPSEAQAFPTRYTPQIPSWSADLRRLSPKACCRAMAERPDGTAGKSGSKGSADMTAEDRALGMDSAITRRDFLGNTAKIIGGAVASSVTGFASESAATSATTTATPVTPPAPGSYYPPLLTGMRGFEDSAMNMGHAVRDGQAFGSPADTGETYDLVVVGSGMSGLSAAYFYRQQVPGAKILVLEGCDDFGGHARRVEFNVDGRQLLVCGGTEELWNVGTFSPESLQMLKAIGIDREDRKSVV